MALVSSVAAAVAAAACATVPEPKFEKHSFPKEKAFIGDVDRPYQKIGMVRSKVDFSSLDFNREDDEICKNYYNAAVELLVKYAQEKGADAVVDVRTVAFMEDGKSETYKTPECSDDGDGGQVLTQGIAVKWVTQTRVSPEPSNPGSSNPRSSKIDPLDLY